MLEMFCSCRLSVLFYSSFSCLFAEGEAGQQGDDLVRVETSSAVLSHCDGV